jgi:hypothetical protein
MHRAHRSHCFERAAGQQRTVAAVVIEQGSNDPSQALLQRTTGDDFAILQIEKAAIVADGRLDETVRLAAKARSELSAAVQAERTALLDRMKRVDDRLLKDPKI